MNLIFVAYAKRAVYNNTNVGKDSNIFSTSSSFGVSSSTLINLTQIN